jgi:VanZ family protein
MKRLSVLFAVFVVAVIILADRGSLPRPVRVLYDFPLGDKLGHFILFGLLNFFLTRASLSAFPSKPKGWVAVSNSLVLALLVAAEEWSQQFFATRTFDPLDLLASCMGLALGGWAAQK